ncbi:hypothetical protein, partial [Pseudomonas sp. 32_A]|uniref:hypothetical protein n=1 Tax=Pseudomonas sp. 32_A TaxID=2813559 RepID=UPI001A9E05FB
MPVTSLRKPFARPPEVAICVGWTTARLEARSKTKSEKRKAKSEKRKAKSEKRKAKSEKRKALSVAP